MGWGLGYGFIISLCCGARHQVEVPPLSAQRHEAPVAHHLAQQLAIALCLLANAVLAHQHVFLVDVCRRAHIVDFCAHVERVALGVA